MEYSTGFIYLIKKFGKLIWKHKEDLITKLKANTIYKNKEVRMSLSYLFSIEIDNTYLLIKGNKIDQLQPIGGVFKYLDTFEDIQNRLGIRNASNNQFHDTQDLRIVVPGQNVPKVVEWFHSKLNRETNVSREFIEELVENNGPLDFIDYSNSTIEFKKCIETNFRESVHFNMLEYNIYEIYKVKLLGEAKEKIKKYILENDNLFLVDAEDIKKENIAINGLAVKIGSHTKYTL